LTVTAHNALDFLRAAYHLGNRHIALEVTETYLRLSPDSVLEDMVLQMGLTVTKEIQPFQPEAGAYHHHDH
jgi:urease accessory protein